MFATLRRVGALAPLRLAAGAAAAALTGSALHSYCRVETLPPSAHRFDPGRDWQSWDTDWDACELTDEAIAKRLKQEWPISDYKAAVHKLYAEHTGKTAAEVDKLLHSNRADLAGLYRRAFIRYAWGGAATRHILLVRHGQYEECRELSKKMHARNPHEYGLPPDTSARELDDARKLTPLGRTQAEKAGDRLAAMLRPVLNTPGREDQVRIRVSTLTRAKETADIIATRLPKHVRQLAPDPLLAEGWPSIA